VRNLSRSITGQVARATGGSLKTCPTFWHPCLAAYTLSAKSQQKRQTRAKKNLHPVEQKKKENG
jgi:hypothetical protein